MPLPRIPLLDRLRYIIERLLLAGMIYRLLVIAAMVAFIALVAGNLVWWLAPYAERDYGETLWWTFLQLTDPGYLGDEEDPLRRVIYTVLVALGLAIFVGALVATMTQWLQQRIRSLERGTTPVPWRGHILVIGWTSRTTSLLRELLQGRDRVRRYLLGLHVSRLRIVVLAENADAEMSETLFRELGSLRRRASIVIRSGDPLEHGHLDRGAFRQAGAVILPADRRERDEADQDARSIAIAGTMAAAVAGIEHRPLLVAEMQDPRRAELLAGIYDGPIVELVTDDLLPSSLSQCVLQPGLAGFLGDILDQTKPSGIYLRLEHDCADNTVAEIEQRFPRGVLLGVLRRDRHELKPLLCPPLDQRVRHGDGLIFLAASINDVDAEAARSVAADSKGVESRPHSTPIPTAPKRVVVAGWNRRTPSLVRTLVANQVVLRPVVSLSILPAGDRERAFREAGIDVDSVSVIEAETSRPQSWERLQQRPGVVVVQGSDRYEDESDADAAALGVLAAARAGLSATGTSIRYIIEQQTDTGRPALVGAEEVESISTARVMAHMLAQAALRPELEPVYEHLFDASRFQVRLRALPSQLVGQRQIAAADLRASHGRQEERVLGLVRGHGQDLRLAIGSGSMPLNSDDRIAVLVPVG